MQLGDDHVVVGREIDGRLRKLIVENHGRFIRWAEPAGNAIQALLNLFALFHGQVVIENDGDRKRKGLGREQSNVLFLAVLENTKVVLGQLADEFAAAVLHRDGNGDKFRPRTQHARRGNI